jgi:transcriptional regulator with XRE-family HTH domain
MLHLETFFVACHIDGMEPENFKAWRKAQGLTQAQAGEQLGVDRGTIIRWENGTRAPAGKLLELACQALGKEKAVTCHNEQSRV